MASGVTLEEAEGKKPDGFFPKLFENVCKNLSNDELDKTTEYKDDVDALVRFTYDLKQVWSLTEFSSISLICNRQVSMSINQAFFVTPATEKTKTQGQNSRKNSNSRSYPHQIPKTQEINTIFCKNFQGYP